MYDCILEVLVSICIELLIMVVYGNLGEGRYKDRNVGFYIFFLVGMCYL